MMESCSNAAIHGLAAGLINVPGVNAGSIDLRHGPRQRVLVYAGQPVRRVFQASIFWNRPGHDTALGIEHYRRGDHRTEERSPPSFVNAGDARPAKLPRGSFETG